MASCEIKMDFLEGEGLFIILWTRPVTHDIG